MKDLISKVYHEKMTDGSFEKIVSTKFEEMIKDVCSDLFKWDGSIKKVVKSKMEELMSSVIERTDFSNYTIKLETIINESFKNSSLADYKQITDSIKNLVGTRDVQYGEKVKVSEIFGKYVKHIEEQLEESDFDDDEINTDDGVKSANVECSIELIEENRYKKIFKLTNEKADDHPKTEIEFTLRESYDGAWIVDMGNKDFKISELRYMPSFLIYLLNLEYNWAKIDIDTTDDTTEAELEFEWEYI